MQISQGLYALLYLSGLKVDLLEKCCPPDAPPNANFNGISETNYTIGDVVAFHCDAGYQLTGDGKMVCVKGDKWIQVGQCDPKSCPALILTNNLEVEPRQCSYHVGDTVRFSCQDDHELAGPEVTSCQSSGAWQHSSPTCTAPKGVQCHPPNDVTYGSYQPVKEMYNVNDTVSYSCDTGYGIEGHYIITCHSTGTWSFPTPKCTALETPQCTDGSWTSYFFPYKHRREGSFSNLNAYCTAYPDMCPEQLPSAVDVVYQEMRRTLQHYRLKNQIVHFDPQKGLTCLHSEQIDGRLCDLYGVRFCLPIPTGAPKCSQKWTQFFNLDRPGGNGDFERMVLHSGNTVCQNYPTSIDARLVDSNQDARTSDKKLILFGALVECINSYQERRCPDIKVRYCCQEITCPSQNWTPFFNLDSPDDDGDYEMIVDARRMYPTQMCSGNVTAIDARHVNNGGWGYSKRSLPVHMDTNIGFWCSNAEQRVACHDFRVRFCCE